MTTSPMNMDDLLLAEDWQLEQSLGLTLFDDPWKTVDFESTSLKSTLPISSSDDLGQLLASQATTTLADPLCEEWMESAGIEEMLDSLVRDSQDAIASSESDLKSWEATTTSQEVKGHEILRSLIEQTMDVATSTPVASPISIETVVTPTISIDDDISLSGVELESPMSPIHLTDMDDIMHSPLSAADVESLLSGSEPASPSSSTANDGSSTCSELQAMLLDSTPPKSNGKSRSRSSPYSRTSRVSKSKSKDTDVDDLQIEFLSKKDKKKLQNKNAAIRYRQKKKQEADLVKYEENGLEDRNKELKDQVDQLSREIKYMKDLMAEVYKAKGVIKT